jgi:hypothetical protein
MFSPDYVGGKMDDRVEGTPREFGSRVQEAGGYSETPAEDVLNQAAAQAQQAAVSLGDVVKARPIAAFLVALAIGYLLGRLTA